MPIEPAMLQQAIGGFHADQSRGMMDVNAKMRREPGIEAGLDEIKDRLNNLAEIVRNLESRLGTILRPADQEEATAPPQPDRPRAALYCELQGVALSIETLKQALVNIHERIEL